MKKSSISAFSLIELSIVILIIGLLIAGVVKGSQLYSNINLAAAQSVTNGSVVPSIKGLDAWYETSLDQSFDNGDIQDGGDIESWYDINPISVSKNHLRQVVGSDTITTPTTNPPSYQKNCINNLPCLTFDESNNENFIGDKKINIQGSGSGSFFVVGLVEKDDPNFNDALYIGSCASNGRAIRFDINTSADGSGIRFTSGNRLFNSPFTTNEPYIATVTFSDASSSATYELYINGQQQSQASIADTDTNKVNDIFLVGSGCRVNVGGYEAFHEGQLSEVIIYNTNLQDLNRIAVEKYLSQKYSIPVNH